MEINRVQRQFSKWLKTPLARKVIVSEKHCLSSILEKIRGHHLLLIGDIAQQRLVAESVIPDKLFIPVCIDDQENTCSLLKEYEAHAIEPDSLDVIVLPHALEIAEDPYQVLHETEMVLKDDGYLMIIGFNPFSLWGIRHFFSFRRKAPWSNKFHYAWRVKDWLRVLNFEIESMHRTFYRPPLHQKKLFRLLKFMEVLGRMLFPFFGGLYIIVAKKRRYAMTPLQLRWKKLAYNIPTHMARSVTRNMYHETDR